MVGWRGILGFDYGIVQAPLGPDISGPDLVAAVANAGALGFLRAPDWESPSYLRDLIRKTRSLTDKPFGVGVVLAFPHEENVKAVIDEKVAVLQVYWGQVSSELLLRARHAGVKLVPQVGSFEEAKKAIELGVDAIIVQGVEAGGPCNWSVLDHVVKTKMNMFQVSDNDIPDLFHEDGLMTLLPRVVDLVGDRDVPIIAAGGIVDGRGYVAALALGARGVCLGTRFVATDESNAHPIYKNKLVELERTEYTNIFGRARWPNAPHRVLQTPFFSDLKHLPDHENEANQRVIGHTTIHGVEKDVRQFAGTVPNVTTTGDIESMAMYAGQGTGLIKEILSAGEVVKRIVEEAQLVIQQQFK